MEPDRPQYERPAACVIAQQYSSANLVSMHFNSPTEKLGARLKKKVVLLSSRSFKNFAYTENDRKSVQSQWGPGSGDREPVYPRCTSANVESQMDLI
jgi:hypothetical protein